MNFASTAVKVRQYKRLFILIYLRYWILIGKSISRKGHSMTNIFSQLNLVPWLLTRLSLKICISPSSSSAPVDSSKFLSVSIDHLCIHVQVYRVIFCLEQSGQFGHFVHLEVWKMRRRRQRRDYQKYVRFECL